MLLAHVTLYTQSSTDSVLHVFSVVLLCALLLLVLRRACDTFQALRTPTCKQTTAPSRAKLSCHDGIQILLLMRLQLPVEM
jgi:hypothetical protein